MRFGFAALVLSLLLLLLPVPAAAGDGPGAGGAGLRILRPADGATVRSPVTVRFALRGSGSGKEPHGHIHLVVDAEVPPPDQPIPASAHYRHFGPGRTRATLELAPGEHTLQLVLGGPDHTPVEPPVVSERITIRVAE